MAFVLSNEIVFASPAPFRLFISIAIVCAAIMIAISMKSKNSPKLNHRLEVGRLTRSYKAKIEKSPA